MGIEGLLKPDKIINDAINHLVLAREAFQKASEHGLILGNDNHIGDIGEYWVRKYFEKQDLFKEYGKEKTSPYDIELTNGDKVSVKTINEWSKNGFGTQIKPLCGKNWQFLAVVFLNKDLIPEKLSLIPLKDLLTKKQFIVNINNREKNNTKAYPRVQWWDWLDDHIVYTSKQGILHQKSE